MLRLRRCGPTIWFCELNPPTAGPSAATASREARFSGQWNSCSL